MKLKRNCLFFNAETGDGGRTPDWGHELGQGRGYLMKEDGCSEIINGLVYNQIKDIENFSYGSGGRNYEMEIISVINSIEIKVYDFQNEVHKTYPIKNPLIAIIAKETKGTHLGRRTLKMNKGFSYNGLTNEKFYGEINQIITNPWFGYKLSYDFKHSGILTLTIIKAPQPEPIEGKPDIVYETAKERKEIWNDLLSTYSEQYDSIDILSEPNSNYQLNNTTVVNKIFYGAPGTGKSHKVNELLKGKEERTERVTFHPEYDYVSFIGGFKPITEKDAVSEKEEIKYKFVPQIFTNIYVDAWNNKDHQYYLVIEEINRGNCAEIFGDIFQLLDRNSDYNITPSNELKQYLVNTLTSENGLKGIENGKMKLPSNLNILATMNTSDQSLFPMDSAFKRRWDWEYIPINYEKSPENPSSDFQVNISETVSFSWLDFIEKVNTVIKENPNLGMDKCIGNYFIKAKDNIIPLEEFINKAIFYLWNDVFKDEDDHIFEENTFYEDFFPIATKGKEKVLKILDKIGLNTPEKED